jgi:hypothetical protein
LGKEAAESSKIITPEENIAPELRASTSAVVEDPAAAAPKKILLKMGGGPTSARGVKRQASTVAGDEEHTTPNKRDGSSSSAAFKGKGKAKASATPEVTGAEDLAGLAENAHLTHADLAEDIPEEYMTADLQSTVDVPASSNLSSLLHHDGDEYIEEQYAETGEFPAGTGEFPAGEAYAEAGAYQDGMSFSEANAEDYAPEGTSHLEVSRPKVSNKGKGVRVIEKHRRKTKYGLIWKSDAELELERR